MTSHNKMSGEEVDAIVEEVVGRMENEKDTENVQEEVIVEDAAVASDGVPTMFGDIHETNVTFCLDTSGSMYNSLEAVKRHLIDVLSKRAQDKDNDTTFNIIEFNTEVTQWSDKMVKCTPETVAVAADWIWDLKAKTGTNILEALNAAFSDCLCDAVYLVTDGHPDQHPSEILDSMPVISQNRPIHCFYIQNGVMDQQALEFLKDLTMETYGSFHVITVAQHGIIERVTPIYRSDASAERLIRTTSRNIYPSNYKTCSLTTTLDAPIDVHVERPPLVIESDYCCGGPACFSRCCCRDRLYHPFRYYYYLHPSYGWSRYRQSRSYMAGRDVTSAALPYYAPGPGSLLIGNRVLARRLEDGYYYLGTVKSEVSKAPTLFQTFIFLIRLYTCCMSQIVFLPQ